MGSVTIHNLKQFLTCNLALKLLCLATAFSVWSISSISRKTCVELSIPLKLCNIPVGFTPCSPPPAVIGYTLSGPSFMIDSARRSNTVVALSMKDAVRPGKTLFMNLDSNLKLPEEIKVMRISPATLEINIEPVKSPQGDQHQ